MMRLRTGSGERMSLNDKMTAVMDAARQHFAVTTKLSLDDLAKLFTVKNIYQTVMPKMQGWDPTTSTRLRVKTDTAQQFYPADQSGNTITVKKGQRISQAFTAKTDGQIKSLYISFYQSGVGHHNVTPTITKLSDGTYRISADFVSTFDGQMLLLDINQLQMLSGTYMEFSDPYAAISAVGGGN